MLVSFASENLPSSAATMRPIRILVDSLADEGLTNAQMTNAREIIRRLDPVRFHVSVFYVNQPDPIVKERPNTKLIRLPKHGQTLRIFQEYVLGHHQILFYMKAAPASKFYMKLRRKWNDDRITVGTVESQSDVRNEPTISPAGISLWENTVLRCEFLFSNSQAVSRSLHREYGLSSEIVATGVDTKFFTPAWDRPSNPRPRVLFAGSLRPFKQPHLLLDAAVHFPDTDYVIAGDGIMAQELRTTAQQRKLANVTFLGALTALALRREYQQADIFLFPSKWEGSPKVILEAAACGLPVIARKDYWPETVIDGETGYLVGSDEEMYDSLRELLSNPELRRKMGRAGRLLSETFDWELITKRWEAIFQQLILRRANGRMA
jgi:glycosyltransferase involved in cell wall biosynthesis